MREIKFRGKRIDNNEWVYGYLFIIWDKHYILWGTTNNVPNKIQVIPETVGQFVGRQDINNKDIYEGDIIINEGHMQGEVEFFNKLHWDSGGSEHSGFYVREWFEYKDEGELSYHDGMDNCKILGNKYENPELLEKK